jgi:hypothetical protein
MLSRDEILAIYRASPEAMVALVEKQWATQVTLERQVQGLTARVAELEARLNKDSHNRHQPPSSDGPAKRPRPRSLRQRSGKKSGGQAGHPGVTRVLVDDPDVVRCSHNWLEIIVLAGGRRIGMAVSPPI